MVSLWALLLVLTATRTALGAEDPMAMFRDAPIISVVTFGPGDDTFSKFGHNAIRVQDKKRRTDLAYNFGTFHFDSPALILDFLAGRFEYWLSVQDSGRMLASYRARDRTIVEQRLNLSPWTANEINEALRENLRPENRAYLYDYYRDNCSTRIRDLIDHGLNGAFAERMQSAARYSFREHTLRLVADDFWLYLGLDAALGPRVDAPITRHAEMFLPKKLEEGLGSVVFSGVHGTHSLVSESRPWHQSTRRKERSRPPERTMRFLQAGALIGALIAFCGWESYKRRQRWAELALPFLLAVLGLVAGLMGWVFLCLWLLTDHEVAHRNENLLQCGPWALGFAIAAYGMLRGRLFWLRLAHRLATLCVAASVLGSCVKLIPVFAQQNQRIIALWLPIWVGVFAACHWMLTKSLRAGRGHAVEGRATALEAEPSPAREEAEDGAATDESTSRGEDEADPPSTVPGEPSPA